MGDGISTRDSDSTRSAARCASIISAGLARNAVMWLAFLAVAGCVSAELAAQDRVLLASSSQPTYQIGERRPELLRAGPVGDPFVVEAPIAEGRRENVCFRAAGDEECFPLGVSEAVSLRIEQGGTHRNVRVVGVLHVPAARFSPEYQAANRGRFQVLLPEVYELVNIGIALTDYAAANPGLVATDTDYYSRAWAHFEPYRGHPFVQALSRGMQEDVFWYFRYKMNAFAFEFDAEGQIVRSVIYDRTGFYDEQTNDLLPLLTLLQDFAQDTDFRSFYRENGSFYDEQVAFFETDADVMAMWTWLIERFPNVRAYDGVKVVFSPLVGPNQSVTWIEEDGYRELQPHINFPYTQRAELSAQAAAIARSEILFTEVNHGFINPTADQYLADIEAALGERSIWADDSKSASNYPNALSLFLEYMNWGLISLYEHDRMVEPDRGVSRARVVRVMVERRGFKQFAAFDSFLVDLYANRAVGETIADLYPRIIAWFATQSVGAE